MMLACYHKPKVSHKTNVTLTLYGEQGEVEMLRRMMVSVVGE